MNPTPLAAIQAQLAPVAGSGTVAHGLLAFDIPAPALSAVARQLKTVCAFDVFLDVTAVDWPGQVPRFEVVYHFYSTTHKLRVRLKARVDEADPSIDSLLPLYGSAAFMERECHEMYGIRFRGHPDLRPLLLYEGFVGHPLRKDYPKTQEQPLVPYRN